MTKKKDDDNKKKLLLLLLLFGISIKVARAKITSTSPTTLSCTNLTAQTIDANTIKVDFNIVGDDFPGVYTIKLINSNGDQIDEKTGTVSEPRSISETFIVTESGNYNVTTNVIGGNE